MPNGLEELLGELDEEDARSVDQLKLDLENSSLPVEFSPEGEHTSRSIIDPEGCQIQPGEIQLDGSFLDAYGCKVYASGVKYQYAKNDKRLKAGGAYSGRTKIVKYTQAELDENPVLALKPRDYQTVLLYMQGKSRRDIANHLDVSEQTVTTRLNKPEVKAFLASNKEQWGDDIHALTEPAIEVLREAMNKKQKMEHRLAASDKVLRANERLGSTKPNTREETATTQLQQVLAALNQTVNVTVNT